MNFRTINSLFLFLCFAIGSLVNGTASADNTEIFKLISPQYEISNLKDQHPQTQLGSFKDNTVLPYVIWSGINKLVRDSVKVFKGSCSEIINALTFTSGSIPSSCEFTRLPFHLERTFLLAQILSSKSHPPTQLI